MRIACVLLPNPSLQAVFYRAPSAANQQRPVAVVSSRGTTVVSASRLARAVGVRPGMSLAAAMDRAPELRAVVEGDDLAIAALGEALLGISAAVDLGMRTPQHHVLYAALPARRRGASYGASAHERLATMGVKAKIGIADDPFTARVAATTAPIGETVTVPCGGSAAFLAPQPLSLLPIQGEVLHMLEVLGVHTLGAFAALPPPTALRDDNDLQAMARGEGQGRLRPWRPTGRLVERLELGELGADAAVSIIAARLASRLAARGPARRLRVTASGGAVDHGDGQALHLLGTPNAAELADLIARLVRPVAGGWIEAEIEGDLEARHRPPEREGLAGHHRRTRRGKARARPVPAAQGQLFAAGDR